MPTIRTAAEFVAAEAREQARIDLTADRLEQTALEDIDYLLHNEEGRDPEVFALLGADPEITITEYDAIPVSERDYNWVVGKSAMIRACTLQVFAEQRGPVLDALDKRRTNLDDNVDMPRSELVSAALAGVTKQMVKEQKEALKNGS